MARSVLLPHTLSGEKATDEQESQDEWEVVEENDENDASAAAPDVVASQQHVVFSPTFQVPAFYFTAHSASGAPLPLSEIVKLPLLRQHILAGTHSSGFALTAQESTFPLLSQGDHPVLGTPSWYLHPCHTAEAVTELLSESRTDGGSEEERLSRWIQTWFVILGQVVNLHSGTMAQ
ncbi:hypothetical protein POSPLADRAFT_1182993 [Postia placenta MAD-698-R-SB12]|uniref:Ubiquitin-like-conjugating enzyme ATG10 n=1 Tax=Postia placenta MAD-698-R-SB12 TaxID=670580 RepID=A0A1X6MW43_9APHY|nr:hypothetical protein POSPLADRAFT_1182993 [Postia placenta MAD-698-R-SB12]OSX60452.1 hypothetical protein POSPLADRAFT_1182993 [Postia placenta MAD-698-R-SB12]